MGRQKSDIGYQKRMRARELRVTANKSAWLAIGKLRKNQSELASVWQW